MQTESEVLTHHTELICSNNIERTVTGRDAVLKQIGALIEKLNDISHLTSRIGSGAGADWAMQQVHLYACRLTKPVNETMPAITYWISSQ